MSDYFRYYVRYRVARWIMNFGLWLIPDGAYKTELLQLLFQLRAKVERVVREAES